MQALVVKEETAVGRRVRYATRGKKRLRNVGRGEKESDRKEAITGQLSEVTGCSLGTR